MARDRILIVEGLPSTALAHAAEIEKAGYEAVVVYSGDAALEAVSQNPAFGAIMLDLQLPDTHGLEWLRGRPEILELYPVILTTADASLSTAIESMRIGAFDYLVKPIAGTRLTSALAVALQQGRSAPKKFPGGPNGKGAGASAGKFIGTSTQMQEVYRQIDCVATSRATIFITGESGTGKEVCAEAIHGASDRAAGPFVAINCGAIPENLLESEIFGHLKGSFTGAVSDRLGAAQAAHKGTLFLDEICEMALPLQVKMLRFLQTGAIQRVGSNRVEKVDVRIICATNRDPMREVAEGRFREDLFYRLAVVPIHMPPLRERKGDISALAEAFLQRFAKEEGKVFDRLGPAQLAVLEQQSWPGNVRELQNLMRRAVVLNAGPELPLSSLHTGRSGVGMAPIPRTFGAPEEATSPVTPSPLPQDLPDVLSALKGLTLDEIERLVINAAIDTGGGSLTSAAKALGVSPSTLYRKRERWQKPPE